MRIPSGSAALNSPESWYERTVTCLNLLTRETAYSWRGMRTNRRNTGFQESLDQFLALLLSYWVPEYLIFTLCFSYPTKKTGRGSLFLQSLWTSLQIKASSQHHVLHAGDSEVAPLNASKAESPGLLLWHKVIYERECRWSNGEHCRAHWEGKHRHLILGWPSKISHLTLALEVPVYLHWVERIPEDYSRHSQWCLAVSQFISFHETSCFT